MNPIQRKANSVEMTNTKHHHGAEGGLRRLRRPRLLTYAAILATLAVMPVAAASAGGRPSLAAPTGLQNFNLRLNDGRRTTGAEQSSFTRTPSFAWAAVRGATHYQFQLSTSKNFRADNGLIWSSESLTTPAASVPISLPWITGPSLYWHVRALGADGAVSAWSEPRGFEVSWRNVPERLDSEPGYVRWTPVPGATAYDLWFGNLGGAGKIVTTVTTVADEREYYTAHTPPASVVWRVRARRQLYGKTNNGLPRVSYGPWSGIYSSPAGSVPRTQSVARPLKTVSAQAVSTRGSVNEHALMPVFVFSKDGYAFHRVYIATDSDCVNIVHVGSIVGGTAYAPRVTGPLALETMKLDRTESFVTDGSEGTTLRTDGESVKSNEAVPNSDSGSAGSSTSSGSSASGDTTETPAPVDLWDSNWASGHYYWTVVPVEQRLTAESLESLSKPQPDGKKPELKYEYQDLMLPQDACQMGNVGMFQKRSTAPQLSEGAPYVTGLSPSGRLLSASGSHRSFYGVPLVAWTPSTGATAYDVEWSRTNYPWRKAGGLQTPATSAVLPLRPGTWYYRVRGIDPWLPGNHMLTWSGPVRVHIARPTFSVHGG